VPLSPYVPFSLVPSLRPRAPRSTLFPYTTLFRSDAIDRAPVLGPHRLPRTLVRVFRVRFDRAGVRRKARAFGQGGQRAEKRLVRSEEHTSELQSRENLVCRLLLEKKKENKRQPKE